MKPITCILVAAGSLIVLGLAGCAANPSASAMCEYTDAELAEIQQAAESGDADKQYDLGRMYYLGRCVPENEEVAAQWYRRASEQGLAEAQYQLSLLYFVGRGVPHDSNEAWRWTHRAAMQGHHAAIQRVCWDNDKCRHLAENGNPAAQYRLAEMYQMDTGDLERNRGQAVRWYAAAAEAGIPEALPRLTTLCDDIGLAVNECIARLPEIERLHAEAKRQRKLEQAQRLAEAEREHERKAAQRRRASIEKRFGRLGIAVMPFNVAAILERPRRKRVAAGGSGDGGGGGGGLPLCCGAGISAATAVTALGVIVAAAAIVHWNKGRLSGEEKQRISDAEDLLAVTLDKQLIDQSLREHFTKAAALSLGESSFVSVEYLAPDAGATRYQALAAQGVATVVEIEISGLGLLPVEKRFRPSQLVMQTRATPIRLDGERLAERTFCYASSDTPHFSEWADDDAKLFREGLEKAHTDIAAQVMAFLAGEEAKANTGACADLQKQSDRDRGPLPQ